MLQVKDLNKVYNNGVHALRNISFDVKPGEFLAIIGLSGSGKSTLLRCLNRLIDPSSGKVFIRDIELMGLNKRELRVERKRVAMIFQHFNLIKRKSVLTNVLFGKLGSLGTLSSVLGVFSEEDRQKGLKLLETVGLRDKAESRADELSGGQQQRVAIARALMQDPDILLADEPVASLDPATSHSVMQYLEKANRELGKTIICNLHFLSLVRQYATRVIALKRGEILFDGDAHEIDEDWFREIYGDDAKEVEIR
ncbi:MAG: phosphonate ABC transporter ATP-binding protein [Deltaproteobacteria bacterium CG11_big_fil_rev_8_21_14_0_20_45_16]|nr:MAG: phosphonate ABC transporter ATP-binding protein [Deltaproteobacteria bacterium CG11_big_fil_rev_8_21_14_0_20_45_16]